MTFHWAPRYTRHSEESSLHRGKPGGGAEVWLRAVVHNHRSTGTSPVGANPKGPSFAPARHIIAAQNAARQKLQSLPREILGGLSKFEPFAMAIRADVPVRPFRIYLRVFAQSAVNVRVPGISRGS
jgi:hypothetical protein